MRLLWMCCIFLASAASATAGPPTQSPTRPDPDSLIRFEAACRYHNRDACEALQRCEAGQHGYCVLIAERRLPPSWIIRNGIYERRK